MGVRRSLVVPALAGLVLVGSMLAGAASWAAPEARQDPVLLPAGSIVQLSVLETSVDATTLLCDPAGGSHPDAELACRDLAVAGGDPDAVPPVFMLCPSIYRPVTGVAVGHWQGEPLRWQRTFANECELHVATGWIFRF